MQVPDEASPSDVSANGQALSPRLDPRPPDDDACAREDDEQKRADAVDLATSVPREQIVV